MRVAIIQEAYIMEAFLVEVGGGIEMMYEFDDGKDLCEVKETRIFIGRYTHLSKSL